MLDAGLALGDDPYHYPQNLPVIGAKGGPGGKPGCGSLPDVGKNWPVRHLVTNTGFGTGMDWRPNPGIGFPAYANYLPVTRAVPEPPSIRNLFGGPAHRTDPVSGCARLRRRSVCAGRHPVVAGPAACTAAMSATGSGSRRRVRNHSWCRARADATDAVAADSAAAVRRPSAVTTTETAPRKVSRHESQLARRAVRLAIFLAVCLLGVFGLYAVFGQLRFGEKTNTYRAEFTNVTGLETNDFVRIAGVEVGQVKNVAIQPDTTALVDFTADDSVVLTEGSRAVIRYDDLIGGRYLALEEGAGGARSSTRATRFRWPGPRLRWTSTR